MAQPFPYFVQFAVGPAVPVASMKASPSKRIFSSPPFSQNGVDPSRSYLYLFDASLQPKADPFSRRNLLTRGSMVATL